LKLKAIDYEFTVCKVPDYTQVHLESEFCFIGKTDEEKSLVCITEDVPANALKCEHGWKAFRIQGVLDFSLIGILAAISSLLAENEIGVFVVSTYNTDYIFIKKEDFEQAQNVLSKAGYCVY